MPLAAASVFEVRTAGNDTNGGGFVTGASGTDYSQQDTKNTVGADISTTDAVAAGTATITSATANFGTTIVGNIIYLQGGTGALAAGRYQVTARASTTSITVDRNVATGTGITMNIGGAVVSPGILGSTTATIPVSGNKIYIKAGTYLITSATANISGGRLSFSINIYIEGYQTTRGDLGTPPLLQVSGVNTFTMLTSSGQVSEVKNVNFDGIGATAVAGVGSFKIHYKCNFSNFTNNAIRGSGSQGAAFFCSITGCSTQVAILDISLFDCIVFGNTITGVSHTTERICIVRTLIYSNTGANSDGVVGTGLALTIINSIAYDNGRDGFRLNGHNTLCINCIAENNDGNGFYGQNNSNMIILYNCAAFSNTVDFSIGTGYYSEQNNSITYTSTAFTNAGAGDFSLNNTAGGGADLRATGLPGVFPAGLTTGYLDIGAAQHQDAGGGGGETSSVF